MALISPVQAHNVILIGSTGHGKSTFGNFLFNEGSEMVFKTSHKMETCTKEPQQQNMICDGGGINIIDTPGLNDQADLPQMVQVLKVLHQIEEVTAVIFCLNFDQRSDINIKATMTYYKNLLEPVFSSQNLILVLTNVNSDDFQETVSNGRLESVIEERKQTCSKLFGITVQVCELVNSVIPAHKKEKVMAMFSNSHAVTEKGPKNIYVSSLLTRQRLLQLIPTMKRINIKNHAFPLPPILESKRVAKLTALQNLRDEIINTVRVESASRANILQTMNDVEEDIAKMEDKVKPIHEQLTKAKGVQKTESLYVYGDEIFFLGRIKNKQISVPVKEYSMNSQSWNCSFSVVGFEKGIISLEIIPDLLSIMKKQTDTRYGEKRWWILVWAEYSGELAFPEKIKELEKEFVAESIQLRRLQEHLQRLKKEDGELDKKLQIHRNRLDEFQKQSITLSHKLFNLLVIEEVVKLIQ